MNKYEKILNIIEKRTLIGTMSRDYGKTVDDVLTINNANELIMLEEALEQAKKEYKLLDLYRKLSKELNLEIVIRCDSWDGIHDFETLDCQVDDLAMETFKKIEQLEEELKEVIVY